MKRALSELGLIIPDNLEIYTLWHKNHSLLLGKEYASIMYYVLIIKKVLGYTDYLFLLKGQLENTTLEQIMTVVVEILKIVSQ